MSNFEQIPEFLIKDIETLKVLADPRRIDILEQLVFDTLTVKDLSAALEMPVSKLYYHVNMLEKHDIIRVVETKVVNGINEKHYRTTALSYRPSHELFSGSVAGAQDEMESLVVAAWDKTRADFLRSAREGVLNLSEPDNLFWNGRLFLTTEEFEALEKELETLQKKYSKENCDLPPPGTNTYSLTVAIFPLKKGEQTAPIDEKVHK